MRFDIVTLFPEAVESYTNASILKKAQEKGLVEVHIHQLRDYAFDKHKTVDDTPYGGGAGMLLKVEPLVASLEAVLDMASISRQETFVVATAAKGKLFTQENAVAIKNTYKRVILFCGRYEGMDERFIKEYCDQEISVGKFILTGGELPALIILDSVARLLPCVLGNEESARTESFSLGDTVEHPHYTKPEEFRGHKVPEVLLSGHHKEIDSWRKSQERTLSE